MKESQICDELARSRLQFVYLIVIVLRFNSFLSWFIFVLLRRYIERQERGVGGVGNNHGLEKKSI